LDVHPFIHHQIRDRPKVVFPVTAVTESGTISQQIVIIKLELRKYYCCQRGTKPWPLATDSKVK